jgi:hypothetical protein
MRHRKQVLIKNDSFMTQSFSTPKWVSSWVNKLVHKLSVVGYHGAKHSRVLSTRHCFTNEPFLRLFNYGVYK